jgi:chaperonin GroES
MRPNHKELEYEPRSRPPKSRKKGRKRYGIEYRWNPVERNWIMGSGRHRPKCLWSIWKRYHTENQRDRALESLRSKGPMRINEEIFPSTFEYRKEPEVKFHPLHDRIVVEYDEPKTKTEGGIVLPDISKTPPTEALVLEMGPGKIASNGELIPMPCRVGDKVLVSISGIELENPDPDSKKKIRLVEAEDILAVENESCNT